MAPVRPDQPLSRPRNATEEVLVEIWSEVLGVERVGVLDDFFALGGHSLLATQVMSRIRERLEIEVPLRELFGEATIARLAQLVEEARLGGMLARLPAVQPVDRGSPLPLSFAQERLWFLDQLRPDSAFYNMPVAVRIRGPLDQAALARSLQAIVARHESLRTTFIAVDGRPQQRIQPNLDLPLPLIDLSGLPADEREAVVQARTLEEAQSPFDLAKGSLLRVCLLRLAAEEYVFLWTMHHIVGDGWSTGVVLRELAELYPAERAGRAPHLPALPVQYADYAAWQRQHFAGEVFEKQLAYWKQQLAGAPEALELPTDRPRPAVQSFRGATPACRISAAAERRAATLQPRGRDDAVHDAAGRLPGVAEPLQRAGRRLHRGADRRAESAGDRTVDRVFRQHAGPPRRPEGRPTFRELLSPVRRTNLDAYSHQDLPFERLVDALQPRRMRAAVRCSR